MRVAGELQGMPKKRDTESGEYVEATTEQEVLKYFDRIDAPVATGSEIAEELDISRATALRKLESLQANEKVGRKEAGARAVVWWALEAPRLSETVQTQLQESASQDKPDNATSHEEIKDRTDID